MKKVLMLFVAMAAMLPASMSAYDFKEGDLYYNVNGNEAAVTFEVENVGSYSGDVVIPETVVHNGVEYAVTAVGYKAFLNCYYLTSIEIPNSIDSIAPHAFRNCEQLQSVVIPNSVVTLNPCAFHSCSSLKSVVIGNSVRVIDEYCFQYCEQLTDVVIGSSVEYLEIKAFYDCPALRKVTCLAPVPPKMDAYYSISYNAYNYGTLYVPEASMQAYRDDENWGRFHNYQNLAFAESIQLNVTTAGLNEGSTLQLTATVQPEECDNKTVIWASNNPSVATIDSNGLVTTHSVGTATITAETSDGSNLSTTCTVTLLPVGLKGDVNGDNNININDVAKLIDYLLSGSWSY